jgi:hypothetical protein
MSEYEDGGHSDYRWVTLLALKKPNEEKARIASAMNGARTFIWEHWQSKKRDYVRLTVNSVDATSTSHSFVEPDSNGVWQVTWRIVRHNNEIDVYSAPLTESNLSNCRNWLQAELIVETSP